MIKQEFSPSKKKEQLLKTPKKIEMGDKVLSFADKDSVAEPPCYQQIGNQSYFDKQPLFEPMA